MMVVITCSYGQDPSFSQFFSSPLNINPALTGNINADWRMIANFRDQWIGPASPYATGSISYDMKIQVDSLKFSMGGDSAVVIARVAYDFQPQSGRRQSGTRNQQFMLSRTGSGWRIDEIR